MARPNGVGGWGLGACPDPRGLGLGLNPSESRPNMGWVGLGCGSEPKGVWVLPCPDSKWVGVGSKSEPKGFGG